VLMTILFGLNAMRFVGYAGTDGAGADRDDSGDGPALSEPETAT